MSIPPTQSRLAVARRRARLLKFVSTGAALAAFGVVSVFVRGAHAGTAGTPAATVATPAQSGSLELSARIAQQAEQSSSYFQPGSIAPSQPSATPRASSHTS